MTTNSTRSGGEKNDWFQMPTEMGDCVQYHAVNHRTGHTLKVIRGVGYHIVRSSIAGEFKFDNWRDAYALVDKFQEAK